MKTLQALMLGIFALLLVACGGYDDDGGIKGAPVDGQSSGADALESTEFFLAVTLPGGSGASAATRADMRKATRSRAADDVAVGGLSLASFSAEVLIPDINEDDGLREVTVDVSRFEDLGDGIYSVEIDGTPQVDTVIYVTINEVRLKVLALRPGSRAEPVSINLQTTVAVDLFLEQVVEEGNLEDLQIDDVEATFDAIIDYLVDVEVPDNLTQEEVLDFLKEEATDSCTIQADGGGGCNLTYKVGGSLTGLQGSVVLSLQNGELLPLTADGVFQFESALDDTLEYSVSIAEQPLNQTCSLVKASGVIAASDIADVGVNCENNPQFAIRGIATGLQGEAQLQLNGGEILLLDANGSFQFATSLYSGTTVEVDLVASPGGAVCTLGAASGVIQEADFVGITLDCTPIPTFKLGGILSNLSGTLTLGLTGDAGTETLPVSGNGFFSFLTTLLDTQAYAVSIDTQPAGQTCSVILGTPVGVITAADVTDIVIDCVDNEYRVGGSVAGLSGSLTLLLNGTDNLLVSSAGDFQFAKALLNGDSYSVTVVTQPLGQTCSLDSSGAGVINASDVTDIVIDCVDNEYRVGGGVAGLSGSLTLLLNGTDSLLVSSAGDFQFAKGLVNGDSYSVTVVTQPLGQTCSLDSSGSGVINASDVTSVAVSCVDEIYTVGGSISGLQGTVTLLLNGLQTLSTAVDGSFTFATPLQAGDSYEAVVVAQPPGQTCAVSAGTGTIGSTNVSDLLVTCNTQTLRVGGTVSGMEGELLLQLTSNTTFVVFETKILATNGAYQFDHLFGSAETYSVSLSYQPVGQTCTLANNSGTVVSSDVANIDVTCGSSQAPLVFSLESAPLVLPGEEVRLSGQSLGAAVLTVDSSVVALKRQIDSYLSFIAPVEEAGAHVLQAVSPAGSQALGLTWAERMNTVAGVAPGDDHNCALQQDGSVLCWGDNSYGQLGNGDATLSASVIPVRVSNLSDAVDVQSGTDFSCALRSGGEVWCWGDNTWGQLGDGSLVDNGNVPVTVSGITTAQGISVGTRHACALLEDQQVVCWGDNTHGQLGDGTQIGAETPVAVAGITGAVQVEAGALMSCAVLADTTVRCWGENGNGQLGDGTTTSSALPVTVSGLSGVSALAIGSSHACALHSAGDVQCWGSNGGNQLGNASFQSAFSAVPIAVLDLEDVQEISAGNAHSCARNALGAVLCWGYEFYYGEMGRGYRLTESDPHPEAVPGIDSAIALGAGDSSSCAVMADHSARCWGTNFQGLLGRGGQNSGDVPDYIYRSPISSPLTVSGDFDAGYDHVCAVTAAQGVQCIGNNLYGQLGDGSSAHWNTAPVAVTGIADAVSVDAGTRVSCSVQQSGAVQCWGYGSSGQLGNGANDSSLIPVSVSGIGDAVDVSVSDEHACAALATGEVRCWGANYWGQLGAGLGLSNPATSNVPVTVAGISDAVAVSVAVGYSCALQGGGGVSCWGENGTGQLGNGTTLSSSLPIKLSGITSAVALTTGMHHGCARLSDGNIQCWGAGNSNTLLGDGSLGGSPRQATFVKGLEGGALSVSAGASHTCAVLDSNEVACWGDNSWEQLGDRPNLYSWPPVKVPGITTAVAVSVGDEYSCARLQDGSLRCWGLNSAQMGPGEAPAFADLRYVPENHRITAVVSGLTDTVELTLNGVEPLVVSADGSYDFITTLLVGAPYVVGVTAQPAGQTCTVSTPSGSISASDITLLISCGAPTYPVNVDTSGLTGFGLMVNLAASTVDQNLEIAADGTSAFATALEDATSFTLSIVQQPVGQTCEFIGGQGGVLAGEIQAGPASLSLVCVALPFTVGGTLNGLQSGAVSLLFAGVEVNTLNADNSFEFSTAVADGTFFNIGVIAQPDGQYCTVTNGGSSFIDGSSITDATVQCVAQPYKLGGGVSGLSGTLVVSLEVSGSQYTTERQLLMTGDSAVIFKQAFAESDAYYVSVLQQPDDQFCTVINFAGTFAQADIGSVSVSCETSTQTPQLLMFPEYVMSGEKILLKGDYLKSATVTLGGQSVTPTLQTQNAIEFIAPTLSVGSYTLVVANTNGPATYSLQYALPLSGVAAIDGGSEFSCARLQDTTLRCWGVNSSGQLGVGSLSLPNGFASAPQLVLGSIGAAGLSVGMSHVCGLSTLGEIYCWGNNAYGQLGDATNDNRNQPLLVEGLLAAGVSAGAYHTCAVSTVTGNVSCWGENTYGQLGDGSVNSSNVAVQVSGLSAIAAVSAGDYHSCALLASPGSIKCWGYNANGQLGEGTNSNSSVPVEVLNISNAVAVAAAGLHTCALLASGEVQCWGDNTYGQLGDPAFTELLSNLPITVSGTESHAVTQLVAKGYHTCAMDGAGEVACWGNNSDGQLGDGTGLYSAKPVLVSGLSNVASIGIGLGHGCAVLSDGSAQCWGKGFNGELGNGVQETVANFVYSTPVVSAFASLGTVSDFSAAMGHACAVVSGQVYCVGLNDAGQLGDGSRTPSHAPVPVTGLNSPQKVYAGFNHSCALLADASVSCWGANDYGQLGAGSKASNSLAPLSVASLSNVISLSVGYRHSCAVTSDKEIHCWGENAFGSLGTGYTGGFSNVPVKVRGITTALTVDVSGVQGTSCAVLDSRQVQCWGHNDYGELGNGSTVYSAIPVNVVGVSDVSAISMGGRNRREPNDDINPSGTVCALTSAGEVYCWGAGSAGQLGLGGNQGNRPLPGKVPVDGVVVALDNGADHACAVLNTGSVSCWGANSHGQLGDGTTGSERKLPGAVPGLTSVQGLSLNSNYGCARVSGGDLRCWGENRAQMGADLVPVTREVRYVP